MLHLSHGWGRYFVLLPWHQKNTQHSEIWNCGHYWVNSDGADHQAAETEFLRILGGRGSVRDDLGVPIYDLDDWINLLISYHDILTVVPNIFGTWDWVCWRQFFHRLGVGGDGFRMIQTHYIYCACSVAKSCLTLCNAMDCSLPVSSVQGISQAGILEWVAIASSRGSSWPRAQTCVLCIGRQALYHWATRAHLLCTLFLIGCCLCPDRRHLSTA